MDLNYLLHHHQLLLARAASPRLSAGARAAAAAKAGRIRRLVDCWRAQRIRGPFVPMPSGPAA